MIGKVIVKLLTDNATLMAIVPALKIFPYIINEDTQVPAIVYMVKSVAPQYDKSGWNMDEITFEVISIAENYAALQIITDEIRHSLELKQGPVIVSLTETITTQRIYFESQDEGYNIGEGLFVARQSFYTNIIEISNNLN